MIDVLHIILPNLFSSLPANFLKLNSYPALKKLLKKAKRIPDQPPYLEGVLKNHFSGLKCAELPSGALGAFSLGLHHKTSKQVWMRCDPVHFKTDFSGVYCLGNKNLSLSQQEICALEKALNEHFMHSGMQLFTFPNNEWYLSLPDNSDIATNDLEEIVGHSISHVLPTGSDQIFWHRLFTECQLLLKTHPVNIAREKLNLPQVQGVWFWGKGSIPRELMTHFDFVSTNMRAIQGMTKLCEKKSIPFSRQFEKMLTANAGRCGAIIDGDLRGSADKTQDSVVKKAILEEYDEMLFKPLCDALLRKRIKQVYLDGCDGNVYYLTRSSFKYFWWRKYLSSTSA
ncbi:MAG TPA: hypothetical protein VFP93_02520 [Gammaproteobacteria bacterium]|nr:hypothetical protein [Gammaproteobacteria bacterium]